MAQSDSSKDVPAEQLERARYESKILEGVTLHGLQHLFWAGWGRDHIPVGRDNALTATHFPSVDIQVQSPAFLWPETVPPGFLQGANSPTDGTTFDRFVRQIADRNSWAQLYEPQFSSEEGRKFTFIFVSLPNLGQKGCFRNPSKLRIWIQGGVHGNEPAGDQSTLALLGKLDTEPSWTRKMIRNIDIMMLPRYSPDGVVDFNRSSALGIDLNRDHVKLEEPQSRYIRRMFCDFEPHIAIDMHEYSARARYGQYIHGSDVMFSAAKNLNIHSEIRNISETLFASGVASSLEEAGFRSEPYVPTNGAKISFKEAGGNAKIGRNAMGLTQCISLLCEVRGIGIADQHFQRRTAAALTFLVSLIQIAESNCDVIHSSMESSVNDFIHSKEDIVLQDESTTIDRTFTVINVKTGKIEQLPVQFASTRLAVPTLTRTRPEAYLIPSTLLGVVQRLIDSGLVVKQLKNEHHAVVQILTIVTAIFDGSYYEGIVPMRVTTKTTCQTRCIQAGTYFVSTRQKNAALAFIALEPEYVDSYVSINVIPVTPGDEYPVHRVMIPLPR